jgi:hypothetical protein
MIVPERCSDSGERELAILAGTAGLEEAFAEPSDRASET